MHYQQVLHIVAWKFLHGKYLWASCKWPSHIKMSNVMNSWGLRGFSQIGREKKYFTSGRFFLPLMHEHFNNKSSLQKEPEFGIYLYWLAIMRLWLMMAKDITHKRRCYPPPWALKEFDVFIAYAHPMQSINSNVFHYHYCFCFLISYVALNTGLKVLHLQSLRDSSLCFIAHPEVLGNCHLSNVS